MRLMERRDWDKRFQGAVNAFLAYTDTQPSPELMDGMPTFLTKGDKDTIANTIRKWTILTSELIRLKALLEETISNKEREILVLKREVKELEMIVERLKADEPFVTAVILDLENNLHIYPTQKTTCIYFFLV
ncbi:unnamed protein product [Brassica oleracea]